MTWLRGRSRHGGADGQADQGGVPGPDSIQVAPRLLRVGDQYAATLAVTGYPAEVAPGWLEPLTSYPGRLDVSVHIEPVPPPVAAAQLRKQRARLESGRRASAERGRLDDPDAEAAADDARELAYRIARGEGRLFRAGLYLTVYASTLDEMAAEVAAVRTLAESLLLSACPVTFRTLQGWVTGSLPLAADQIRMRRVFDTAALAAAFPFASPDLAARDPASAAAPGGVLYGLNAASSGVVCWDRWAQDNHNSVIIGRSGGGKSYLAKLDILRSLYTGVQVAVIDPEDEYTRLAAAIGGTSVRLGGQGVRLNPFDLPQVDQGRAPADGLMRRALFLHTFLAVLLGEPIAAAQRAALDQAIMATYQRAGITSDPRTWTRPAPLLADLAGLLRAAGGEGAELAARLVPFTDGTHSALFNAPTSTQPGGHLVTWSLRDLPDELKTPGVLLTLDAIWRQVTDPAQRRRRLVVVDEGWLLMRQPEGAAFLFRMAKAARKHWAGLAVVTQDAEDVLGSELGRAVVANAATQILLRQAPQAIGLAGEAFRLSVGEREFLLSARQGEGLLAAGASDRVAFTTVASDFEHQLATTDPEFLASLQADSASPEADHL